MSNKVFVRLAEMPVSEESPIGGEWRWVRGGQYQMPASVNEFTLFLGKRAPKDKYQMILFLSQQLDYPVCKSFPAMVLV